MNGERSRLPTRRSGVAHGAIHRQIKRGMAGIEGWVVIKCMTGVTGIGRIGIVAVMAGITIIGNGLVRTCKRIDGIMVESGWCPGRLGVAGGTIGWELRSLVVGGGSGIVFRCMATGASVGRVVVIAVVASSTIIGNTSMCPVQGMIILVYGE